MGQRAAKLLAVKVGGIKKKSAALAIAAKMYTRKCGLGSSLIGLESFSKFEGW